MRSSPAEIRPSFSADQRILVTGASSGIGEAIALRLNALGATVIASGRNAERLEANTARAAFPKRFCVEARDLADDPAALPGWIAELRGRYGKLYGLAHAAGVTLTASLREYDLAAARALFDLLFHAPMLLAKGFADRRNNAGPGSAMLFVAAAAAVLPSPALLIYSSAKGALITAARCMSKELAPAGLRVNCVSPGLIKTPLCDEFAALIGPEAFSRLADAYPLGIGEPEDVSAAAAYLLSPQARRITGQNLLLAGGLG